MRKYTFGSLARTSVVSVAAGGVVGFALGLLMGEQSPVDYALWFFQWNGIAAIAVALVFFGRSDIEPPALDTFTAVLPWLVPLALVLIIPAGFAVIYGPTQLNPGIAGILFMVEIGVGTITASILTDEPFGWRELLGVLMITAAALIEPLRDLYQHRTGHGESAFFDVD